MTPGQKAWIPCPYGQGVAKFCKSQLAYAGSLIDYGL